MATARFYGRYRAKVFPGVLILFVETRRERARIIRADEIIGMRRYHETVDGLAAIESQPVRFDFFVRAEHPQITPTGHERHISLHNRE
jgi:hypothetical protein